MRADVVKARSAAARIILVAALAFAVPARAQVNPSMSTDFTSMMSWLSGQIAQGLGFSAGETLDTPHEVTDKRIQPDISFGAGNMPLNKSQFPVLQTPALTQMGVQSIFPSSVLFPNLSAHLRAGLPWRMDLDIRGADMTTPPGYKISPTATASGHSNSIGFGVRKHFFGGENPMLTVGTNFNHVFGTFDYNTNMAINTNGFTANAAVGGNILWNVNSYGLNAVVSQKFGHWTPFMGLGESYVTGSVRSSLTAYPDTFLITPITGAASARPEALQARVIGGSELAWSWVNLFVSGEVKAGGVDSGKSWIMQAGISLPFHIGVGGGGGYASSAAGQKPSTGDDRPRRSRHPESTTVFNSADPDASTLSGTKVGSPRHEMFGGPVAEKTEAPPPLIFIQ